VESAADYIPVHTKTPVALGQKFAALVWERVQIAAAANASEPYGVLIQKPSLSCGKQDDFTGK